MVIDDKTKLSFEKFMRQDITTKLYLLLIVLSIFIILPLTFANGGIWSTDSLNYFAAARNLLKTNSFVTYNGTPYTLWPPLYPLLLFVGLKCGLSLSFVSVLINTVALAVTYVLFYKTLTAFLDNVKILFLFSFSVILYPPFLTIFTRALTESLFVALVSIFLYLISLYIAKNQMKYLILSSFVVALSCLQRYLGITLITAGIVAIFLLSNKSIYQKIKEIIIFTFISVLPLLLWLFRNFQLTGTLTGSRFGKARYGIETAVLDSANTLFDWIFRKKELFNFLENNHLLSYVFIFTLILCLIIAMFYVVTKSISNKTVESLELKNVIFYTHVLFIICYIVCLVYLSVNTNVDRLSNRLLSPIYPSVLLVFFYFFYSKINKTKLKRNQKVVYFIVGFWFINTLFVLPSFVKKYVKYEGGWGYQTKKWVESDISFWLRHNKLEGKLFSNRPEFAFYNSNQFTFSSPYRGINLFSLKNVLEDSYLIWFKVDKERLRHTPKDISKYYSIFVVKELNSGCIYKIGEKKVQETKFLSLGKTWNVTEGIWVGTWVKRDNTNIFDAEWVNRKTNKKIKDVLILEKFSEKTIILLRQGFNKRYFGFFEPHKKIIVGTTQWGTKWHATILR
jgi:4-amino-4-deoxy-L-arabinose transferase-like glycosyltransferase